MEPNTDWIRNSKDAQLRKAYNQGQVRAIFGAIGAMLTTAREEIERIGKLQDRQALLLSNKIDEALRLLEDKCLKGEFFR